jgi:hypothetical protein
MNISADIANAPSKLVVATMGSFRNNCAADKAMQATKSVPTIALRYLDLIRKGIEHETPTVIKGIRYGRRDAHRSPKLYCVVGMRMHRSTRAYAVRSAVAKIRGLPLNLPPPVNTTMQNRASSIELDCGRGILPPKIAISAWGTMPDMTIKKV